ncbi:3-oxoacyl-[acyl-carrier-protein] synthase III C-terminal domain-containing protein [Chloroflexota bacterium]
MVGIISYGAHVPYYRLPRSIVGKAWGKSGGRGEKAVANFDEDPITISVAAGIDCLTGFDPKTVDGLFMATTSSPYKERQNSSIVSTALDLRPQIQNADFTNCLRAGTIALLLAMDTIKAGSAKRVMVTAADTRLGFAASENEQAFGDGGATLLMGDEAVAVQIEGSYTLSEDFPDYWRAHNDSFVRSWEDRFGLDQGYRKFPTEAAAGVMKKLNLTPKDFTKVCFYGPDTRRHTELGKAIGFEPAQVQESLLDTVGNTGTALALMILVSALEEAKAGDRILLISYGNGSDALVLRVTDEIEKIKNRRGIKQNINNKKILDNYEKYLRWRGLVPLQPASRPMNPTVSMASLWRENRSALPLCGVKCKKCGTPQLFLNFASTRARVCLECHAKDEFENYRFADKKGKVVTFSHDYLASSGDPPNTLTIVDFDGGGRGSFEMTDRHPEECQVGMTVEMTFRKISFANGIHNYFWKCRPVRD